MSIIIAMDFDDSKKALDFLALFKEPIIAKIGMELFYKSGPDIVEKIKKLGHHIFIDLKLCDIPNTVYSAMKVIGSYGADIVNLHAFGGIKMMKEAKRGLIEGSTGKVAKLIAVTQLTSSSPEMIKNELLIDTPLDKCILQYAKNAKLAGLDGVVCSPLEVRMIKDAIGEDFLTLTPGIRYPEAGADDQFRITTPEMAGKLKTDYIVVGRPITRATDPIASYERINKDYLGGKNEN